MAVIGATDLDDWLGGAQQMMGIRSTIGDHWWNKSN